MGGLPGLVALMCVHLLLSCLRKTHVVCRLPFRQAPQVQWRACCRSSDAIICYACRQATKQISTPAVLRIQACLIRVSRRLRFAHTADAPQMAQDGPMLAWRSK